MFDSTWTVMERTHDSHPLLIRHRSGINLLDRIGYETRLNIIWRYSGHLGTGLPTAEDSAKLVMFEDLLVEAVECDRHSILTMVLTCNKQREFVFHTTNPESFMLRLSDMPQNEVRYPIQIFKKLDLNWAYDESVLTATS